MAVLKACSVVLVAFLLVGVGIIWRENRLRNNLKNESNQIASEIEAFKKDMDGLNKMIAEMEAAIAKLPHLPKPTNGVTSSYHDDKNGKKNYEDADIQDIDLKEGLVLVTTKESKISIVLKPTQENLDKFHIGWIAPVTFQCTKLEKGKCDFKSPYKLFVLNGLVEVKQLILPKK